MIRISGQGIVPPRIVVLIVCKKYSIKRKFEVHILFINMTETSEHNVL